MAERPTELERLTLENFQRTLFFDTNLRRANRLEQIVAEATAAIILETDPATRKAAIAEVVALSLEYFTRDVLPAGLAQGSENARALIAKLPAPADLGDAATRQGVLFDLEATTEERIGVVQHLLDDQGNTLENRLAAYHLEPNAGTPQQKVSELRTLHADMEAERREFETKLRQFNAGEIEQRPRKPKLDYLSEYTAQVKEDFREQARRAATDAEVSRLVKAGYTALMWVVVNAGEACPDCRYRAGVVGTFKFWQRHGLPGTGRTICGSACFCQLVPMETAQTAPSLATARNLAAIKLVRTTPEQKAEFDRFRVRFGANGKAELPPIGQ